MPDTNDSTRDEIDAHLQDKAVVEFTSNAAYKNLISVLRNKHGIKDKNVLGKGSYSVVLKAIHKQQTVAIKVIDTRSGSSYVTKFLPREKEIVTSLNHFNVVKVPEIIHVTPYCAFITEFCENGDILKKIIKCRRICESEAKQHTRQLVEALMYLQSKDIIHRDLKCENVFLDAYDNVKLGDFGFSRKFLKGEVSDTFCGSRAYVAPEILRAKEYTGFGVDLWSLGIVIFVMVTGVMPFNDENPTKMVEQQLQHKIRYPPRMPLSTEVKTLIYALLHPFPPLRPSYEKVLQFLWLKDVQYTILGGEGAIHRGKA